MPAHKGLWAAPGMRYNEVATRFEHHREQSWDSDDAMRELYKSALGCDYRDQIYRIISPQVFDESFALRIEGLRKEAEDEARQKGLTSDREIQEFLELRYTDIRRFSDDRGRPFLSKLAAERKAREPKPEPLPPASVTPKGAMQAGAIESTKEFVDVLFAQPYADVADFALVVHAVSAEERMEIARLSKNGFTGKFVSRRGFAGTVHYATWCAIPTTQVQHVDR